MPISPCNAIPYLRAPSGRGLRQLQLTRWQWRRYETQRTPSLTRASPRDAKIFTIFEGTSEIQRLIVGRTVTGLLTEAPPPVRPLVSTIPL
ncbi:acyl-CoA dehydrogenase family protein [Streptomyces rubiginosohelvolus]|uniref:acyl-CoA dehydrogenase family protein n=1 Tax=Streptomyces TaxID=1883 RepID=UPI001C4A860F|nr:acyl-CoA dehydrogenase family protein [Streptomyces sp. MNU77]